MKNATALNMIRVIGWQGVRGLAYNVFTRNADLYNIPSRRK